MLKRQRNEATIKIPEFEEIVAQIRKQLPKITEVEIEKIAIFADELINKVIDLPATNYFKGEEAKIVITSWHSLKVMVEVMHYPELHSRITIEPPKIIAGIEFFPVLVYNTKEVYLHYIHK